MFSNFFKEAELCSGRQGMQWWVGSVLVGPWGGVVGEGSHQRAPRVLDSSACCLVSAPSTSDAADVDGVPFSVPQAGR